MRSRAQRVRRRCRDGRGRRTRSAARRVPLHRPGLAVRRHGARRCTTRSPSSARRSTAATTMLRRRCSPLRCCSDCSGGDERGCRSTRPAYTQPALFALEYALAELLAPLGRRAGVVLGHSVGEYVAACVAGVLQLRGRAAADRRARPADAGAARGRRDGCGVRRRGPRRATRSRPTARASRSRRSTGRADV